MDREELIDFLVTNHHISHFDAERAVTKCLLVTGAAGAAGWYGGAILGILLSGPLAPGVTPVTAYVGAGGAAVYSLLNSRSCSDVRQAVKNWIEYNFNP